MHRHLHTLMYTHAHNHTQREAAEDTVKLSLYADFQVPSFASFLNMESLQLSLLSNWNI